jgi:hypothetical protein
MLVNIPTGSGSGYLKSGSVYLRARVDVVQTAAGATSWKFSGPSGLGGASSLINRMVISCGGTQVSMINAYNRFTDAVVLHATTRDYIEDLRELEYRGVEKINTAADAGNLTAYVTIPILAPIFNSANHVPLFLMNSPISVEITTESVTKAFTAATTAVTNYTISEASICYETIDVSDPYKMAMKERLMATGGVFSMDLNDTYNLEIAATNPLDYNIGLSLSSLKGVLLTYVNNANLTITTSEKDFIFNGLTDLKLYVDNRLINSNLIDSDNVAFAEMNKCLGRLYDKDTSSMLAATNNINNGGGLRNNYTTNAFLAGINTSTVSDYNLTSSGVPCQQLSIHAENNNGAGGNVKWQVNTAFVASTMYAFILYDSVVSIDGMGVVSVRR